MRFTLASFCAVALGSILGCSNPSTGTGDTGATPDTGGGVVDSARPDTGVDAASSVDSGAALDAPLDAFSDIDAPGADTGIDAASGLDSGSDAGSSADAGRDAASRVDAAGRDGGPGSCSDTRPCLRRGDYCHTPVGMCGGTGTCEAFDPTGICPLVIAPVCGCDGNDYQNSCEAQNAGTSVDYTGMCRATTPLCCTTTADCGGRGQECVIGPGVCKRVPTAGMCWSDDDCPGRQTCTGGFVCDCGSACFAPDSLGTCG